MVLELLLASADTQIEANAILSAIHRTRYECVSIENNEYLGQNHSQQEFLVTCSGQHKYLISIDNHNLFRVWKK